MNATPVSPALAAIPAGVIEMRDARSGVSRSVALSAFSMAVVPMTDDGTDEGTPVHGVTWFQAIERCNELSGAEGLTAAYEIRGRDVRWDVSSDGYRLPTEAEWEWACRAGTTAASYGPLDDIAWTARDRVSGPQPVARKLSNAFGLFDTIGNVWEWCWDYADPARYFDYRSLRGGGWDDPDWSCRASVRRGSAPDATLEDVGFRAARGAVGAAGAEAAQGWSAEADRRRASVTGPLPVGWTPLR